MHVDRDGMWSEWRDGGAVAFSAALGMGVAVVHLYSLGVFIQPLEQAFGWSRADISAGPIVLSILFVICNPLVGLLLDRFSARVIALPGLLVYAGGLALLGAVSSSIWSWWGAWLLLGIGATCISATVWTLGVARRFDKSRGLAFAVVLAGTGLSSATMPALASTLIDMLGWRMAYVALGVMCIGIALPPVYFFFRDTDAATPSRTPSPASPLPREGMHAREAFTSYRYWRLALATLFAVVGVLAMLVHFVPILYERGFERGSAVYIAGLIGGATIIGRLASGFLLDRIHGTWVGAVAFAAPAISCLLLMEHGNSLWLACASAIVLGLALGAEIDVAAYLTSRYFGLRNYGVLFGVINVVTKVGTGLGPLIAGMVYDRFGSYDSLFPVLIAMFLGSALLILSLGRYPQHTGSTVTVER